MRTAQIAAALMLAMACAYVPTRAVAAQAASAPAAATSRILVSGVPDGSTVVQRIVDAAYETVAAAAGNPASLSAPQWQQVVAKIDADLKQAGFSNAHAYLADQLAAFSVHPAGAAVAAAAPPPASAPAQATNVLPSVPQREAAEVQPHIAVRGFSVHDVGDHPKQGITPASVQKLADAELAKLGGGPSQPAQLDFDQLQGVADAITKRYREAGFIVAKAYVPEQTVGKDDVVGIDVLEGRIGKIKVQGTKHYKPWVIAASAEKLKGKPLLNGDVDTALLYDRDLPGVAVTSTFQPGTETGTTDLIMVAHEQRPLVFTTGLNNYGTEVTGRYRADAGVEWNNPLGIGDKLAANIDYAFDPHQNTYGSLSYEVPMVKLPGFGFAVGADRSQLQLNSGQFAALDVNGPTSRYFAGARWKFVNTRDLAMSGSLQYIDEHSHLSSLGFPLSDERFKVAQLGFALNHTDRGAHGGLDTLTVSLRTSLEGEANRPDLVSPNHARKFSLLRVGYTRIQFLSPNQQLFFKFAGQYTNDALVPMEQFVIGGPDSVRAYPIADALSDRGYYTALEYHVNAPGFANKPSPFRGQPWGELLTFETFLDYARGFPAGANRQFGGKAVTYSGAGAGLIFRLPRWHSLLFRLDGAVPLGSQKASDGNDYQIYTRFDLTF